MNKKILVLIETFVLIFLVASVSFSSPSYTDREFTTGEWTIDPSGSFQSVTVGGDYSNPRYENANSGFTASSTQFFVNGDGTIGPGGGGQPYDAEYLGLFIDDTYLYFGLQTGFNLKDGVGGYEAGDIAIDFSADLSDTPDFEFGIDLNGSGVDPKDTDLYKVSSWTDPTHSQSAPFQIKDGYKIADERQQDSGGNLLYNAWATYGTNYSCDYDLIEGKIKLSVLQDELTNFDFNDKYYVTLHWTMGCGNDFLRKTIEHTPQNPVPEPATLLLFGMGLLGAGMYGRKNQNKKA